MQVLLQDIGLYLEISHFDVVVFPLFIFMLINGAVLAMFNFMLS